MDAVKYLKERSRMCKNHTCCSSCPLNEEARDCRNTEKINPEEAVEIVEKWSKENPQKTILQDYVEKHPNAPLRESGLPKYVCPNLLGYIGMEQGTCPDCLGCWNRPLEG